MTRIEETGIASAEVLIALARAAGASPLRALEAGGYLRPEETLTAEEQVFLQMLRETKPDLRRVAVAGLRAAWGGRPGIT